VDNSHSIYIIKLHVSSRTDLCITENIYFFLILIFEDVSGYVEKLLLLILKFIIAISPSIIFNKFFQCYLLINSSGYVFFF
jgi:hypothetical protein